MSSIQDSDPTSRTINVPLDDHWQVKDIQAGLEEADRGEFASDAEIEAVYQRYNA